ncbi:MAG TPA: hypothetical protein VGD91_06635 [Trebonia sp.]
MKMRLALPRSAWLMVGRSAAGAALVAVTVSACTGNGSVVPPTFTPTPQTSGQAPTTQPRTPSPTGGGSSATGSVSPATRKPTATPSKPPATSTHHASASPSPRRSIVSTPSKAQTPLFPTAPPETGGGGTAGLQDGVLFGGGGLAVLAGLGSLAYRRRLRRRFAPGRRPAPRDPADRHPADR